MAAMSDEERRIRKKLRHCWSTIEPELLDGKFQDVEYFINWGSQHGGGVATTRLCRKDERKPYSPRNCFFSEPVASRAPEDQGTAAAVRRWNKFIAQVRRAYGLPPLRQAEDENENT